MYGTKYTIGLLSATSLNLDPLVWWRLAFATIRGNDALT